MAAARLVYFLPYSLRSVYCRTVIPVPLNLKASHVRGHEVIPRARLTLRVLDYIPHPSDVGKFFDDYYRELASHGIRFTKCDNMASLDNLVSAYEVTSITSNTEVLGAAVSVQSIPPAYKNAVLAAAEEHFGHKTGGRVIFCMEMTPRVLLGDEIGWPGSHASERHVLRNSCDYFPDQPESHRYHIFTNLVNVMFTSQLNIVPDFDMVSQLGCIRFEWRELTSVINHVF